MRTTSLPLTKFTAATTTFAAFFTILAACSVGHATLISVSTNDGTGADADVDSLNRNTPSGSSVFVHPKLVDLGNYNTVTNRKAYLRFDTGGDFGPNVNATLRLWVGAFTGGTSTLEVWGLNDGYAGGGGDQGENWNESTIDWNDAPANTGNGAHTGNTFDTALATNLGTITQAVIASGTEVTFTDPDLDTFLGTDTDGLITIMMLRTDPEDGGVNSAWRTKEHGSGQAPQLDITVVPEPSTFVLGISGLMGLGFLRRRKRG